MLGAPVRRGPAPEIGTGHVRLTAAGGRHPVLGAGGDPPPVLPWHQDTVDLPADAVLPASSDAHPHRAFRAGRAHGLQFHVGMDAAAAGWRVLTAWARSHPAPPPRLGRVDAEGPPGWAAPLHAAVLDATGVARGSTVLDLGCGTGPLARAAADRGARVIGIDLDPGAVAQAAAEVPEGAFLVRSALDPPPGPFDAVAAVQLLGHVADPVAVLHRAGRVGGVVAATAWGRERECDLRVLDEALAPWLGPRRPARASPERDPARLQAMAGRAGLAADRVLEVVCAFEYPDADDLLLPLMETAAGRAAARRARPGAVRSAVLERLEPYRTAAGGYRLHNLLRVLVARPR